MTRTVLITGCSSGIGAAAARELVRRGWVVYASARRLSDLAPLEAAGCRTVALDVTDEASMQAAVSAIEAEHGSVGALVNNAGYSQSGAVEAVPLDRVRAQFETNVFGLIRLSQLVLPGMRRARRGRIVNIGSMGGTLTFPGGGIYHATKHAVEALSDAMRFEVRGFGVQVVLIQPGLIRTPFGETAAAGVAAIDGGDAGDPYASFHAAVARTTVSAGKSGVLGRLSGTPEDVARTIARALSDARPRARYTVSPSAAMFMKQHALLGDKAWDAFLRRVYPSPGSR